MRLPPWFTRAALLAGFALLAGCRSQQPAAPPPAGTFAPQMRGEPTLPPPDWIEGSEPITIANAARIAYIGRLDAATTPSTVFAYAFSPDGTRLAGLNNEQLIGWDLVTGKIVFNTTRSEALFVYYSADKSEVYTLDGAGSIRVYDADSGRAKDMLSGHARFNGVATYYPNDGYLALGGQDGVVRVWDPAKRQSLVTFTAHRLQITALAFSDDGTRLATASDEPIVRLWDWAQRQQTLEIASTATQLAISPDGQQVACGEAQTITLWNSADGRQQHTLNTGPGAVSDVLRYSPDGQFLLNGGAIPNITVWDARSGLLVNTLPGVGGDVTTAAFSADGSLLATSVLGGAVTLWDMSRIRDATLARADLPVNTRQILYTDWSPDGFLLTMIDATGPIQVWGIPPTQPES